MKEQKKEGIKKELNWITLSIPIPMKANTLYMDAILSLKAFFVIRYSSYIGFHQNGYKSENADFS